TTWHIDDEYLFGPDLLVAPMFKPRGSRAISLPARGWCDYWTDPRFDGARWITYEAELETLPLFVRAGAVIPIGSDLQDADERSWDPVSFEVYLGGDGVAEMELTDDPRRLHFTTTVDREKLRLEGGPLDYAAAVRVHGRGGAPPEGRLGQTI